MRESWLKLIDQVWRPERRRLDSCRRARDLHFEVRRPHSRARARALAECESRIESARAQVFAANDGVVASNMTVLEREWLTLSRRDADGEMMDLWACIAPSSWLDRKRWRDAQPEARVEVALALASDVAGVESAEASVDSLAKGIAQWGFAIGPRIRWGLFERDFDGVADLFAGPLRSALEVLDLHGSECVVFDRAQALERAVLEAALTRFPEREVLAVALAHTAFVDCVWRAAALTSPLGARPNNPMTPLCNLWRSGYVLGALDEGSVTLALPSLD
jgi:hypothetical protein